MFRRFELIGVPLQCLNDGTIKRIGSVLGDMVDICYKQHDFLSVEITVKMELTNPNHNMLHFVNVQVDGMNYRVIVKEVDLSQGRDDDVRSKGTNIDAQHHESLSPENEEVSNFQNEVSHNIEIIERVLSNEVMPLLTPIGEDPADKRNSEDNEIIPETQFNEGHINSDDETQIPPDPPTLYASNHN